jgi:hypothetical protein
MKKKMGKSQKYLNCGIAAEIGISTSFHFCIV